MSTHVIGTTRWATASAPEVADSLPMELTALGAHADNCNESRGKAFAFRCMADAVHSFLAPRVITTLVVVGIVFGIVAVLL
jgi:hypothetical protein